MNADSRGQEVGGVRTKVTCRKAISHIGVALSLSDAGAVFSDFQAGNSQAWGRLPWWLWPSTQAGIHNVYFKSAGAAHEGLTWRRCLNVFAPRLFK